MTQYDRRNSQNASIGDNWTADRVNDINQDLDSLFKKLDPRAISLTYDVSGRLTQISDTQNSTTINLDWTNFNDDATPYLDIQEVGDTNRFRISYVGGLPDSIEYI